MGFLNPGKPYHKKSHPSITKDGSLVKHANAKLISVRSFVAAAHVIVKRSKHPVPNHREQDAIVPIIVDMMYLMMLVQVRVKAGFFKPAALFWAVHATMHKFQKLEVCEPHKCKD